MKRTAVLVLTLSALGSILALPVSAKPDEEPLAGTWRGQAEGPYGAYTVEMTFGADSTYQAHHRHTSGLQVLITGRWYMVGPGVYRQYNEQWSPRTWGRPPYVTNIVFRWTERHKFRFLGPNRVLIDGKVSLHRVR